ncbi:YidH family protein [Bdellovibrio sp. HCB288]|uniref:YidH family protein n=1 Tax=Bdellovibrio sp. HCB288 TaxID=3394355 RepID=UPI0039B6151E
MEIEPKKDTSTDLAQQRTTMAVDRTGMAEDRTSLATARSHLANERTHLAYMRTGISLVSLGITMNRFSWFMMDNKSISRFGGIGFLNDAKNIGLGMVILGSAMLVWSLFRYNSATTAINNFQYQPAHRSVLIFTLVLILLGVGSTIWLIV